MRMGEGMSILVSYRPAGRVRQQNWEWLKEYWKHEMPGAQVCVADDGGTPFSRAASINLAAQQATGDVFWVADADFMMRGTVLHATADLLRRDRAMGYRSWYHGSGVLYRTTRGVRNKIIRSDPANPYYWPASFDGSHRAEGPASELLLTRECFEYIGGFDSRFRGWGGEEFSMKFCLGTLWGLEHKLGAPLIHLWHPVKGVGLFHRDWTSDHYRPKWRGQERGGISAANQLLLDRYAQASDSPEEMWQLLAERDEYVGAAWTPQQ